MPPKTKPSHEKLEEAFDAGEDVLDCFDLAQAKVVKPGDIHPIAKKTESKISRVKVKGGIYEVRTDDKGSVRMKEVRGGTDGVVRAKEGSLDTTSRIRESAPGRFGVESQAKKAPRK